MIMSYLNGIDFLDAGSCRVDGRIADALGSETEPGISVVLVETTL
jgi:hypothetical protein